MTADGSMGIVRRSKILSFQVGADTTAENKIEVSLESMSAKGIGVNGLQVNGKDSTKADAAVKTIATAIQKVSTQRSALGAVQNKNTISITSFLFSSKNSFKIVLCGCVNFPFAKE